MEEIAPPPLVDTDTERVKQRMESLEKFHSEKPYQRQKSSLQKQLESFLWSLPEHKSLKTATPNDVISFLIWRDKFGKTVVHSANCPGSIDKTHNCNCPKNLAAGTIDNNIGKLRSIFQENGRGTFWNDDFQIGNPASHHSVKKYQALVLEEQTIARTFPSQAIPIFLDKLSKLCSYLRELIVAPNKKPSERYILARDLAFFSADFFSGDRGSDLGRVRSSDVLSLPDGKGFLINQVFGKTLRGNGANVFGLKQIPKSPFCPVTNIQYYLALSKKMDIDLQFGFLFRVTDRQGNISDAPFTGSAVANRLRKHLKDKGIFDGETVHGFRSGCSITLSLLGASYTDVARHVGWKSVEMALHYSQYDKVMTQNDASSLLSNSSTHNSPSEISLAEKLGQEYRNRNFLQGYKPIFT